MNGWGKETVKMAHGGDCYTHVIDLDFSVNLNPLGIPEAVSESLRASCTRADRYPDLSAGKLREDIAAFFDLRQENVLAGNGASELLMAAVHALRPEKAVLPVPSFSGYAHVLKAVNCPAVCHETQPENAFQPEEDILAELTADTDLLILTNPGNPAGGYLEEKTLERILDRCEEQDITVILDECFMELSDAPERRSMCRRLKNRPKLLLLRAFTKSFAIPAVRLGYFLSADTGLLSRIAAQLPEWNVSLQAQEAGCAALRTRGWLERARDLIRKERAFLVRELEKLGFAALPSDAGYLVFRDEKKRDIDWYRELLKKKILIRDCADYRGMPRRFWRIAVKKHEENEALLAAMKEIAEA